MTDVAHYTVGDIETIDYIYDKLGADGGLQYVLGNILKYASRAEHKGQLRSDLIKIGHYAELALERLGPPEPEGVPQRFVVGEAPGLRAFNVGDDEPADKETIVLVGFNDEGWCRLQYGQHSSVVHEYNPEGWWQVAGTDHNNWNTRASWEYWLKEFGPLTEVL